MAAEKKKEVVPASTAVGTTGLEALHKEVGMLYVIGKDIDQIKDDISELSGIRSEMEEMRREKDAFLMRQEKARKRVRKTVMVIVAIAFIVYGMISLVGCEGFDMGGILDGNGDIPSESVPSEKPDGGDTEVPVPPAKPDPEPGVKPETKPETKPEDEPVVKPEESPEDGKEEGESVDPSLDYSWMTERMWLANEEGATIQGIRFKDDGTYQAMTDLGEIAGVWNQNGEIKSEYFPIMTFFRDKTGGLTIIESEEVAYTYTVN